MTYLIVLVPIITILYFILKPSTSKKQTISKAVPTHWHNLLYHNILFYKKLSIKNQSRFRDKVYHFLNDIHIEAVAFELTELDRLLVASSGVIPIFNFDGWTYPNLSTVLIYPNHFNINLDFSDKAEKKIIGGVVGNGSLESQMILSRKALYQGFLNKTDKGNTGIHEFVHLLDKLDGSIDGIPEQLIASNNIAPWIDLMFKKMEAINNDQSDIRSYGGTSKEEFFAVASEYFFERPKLLKRKHADLYAMLKDCFGTN